ncbi:MAG TPA: hypothetical protein VI282_01225, partial [Verrucomicrobiae bacterium]
MALSILIGVFVYLGHDRKSAGEMTVHFSGYTTNSAGIRECTVMFENAGWDCIITPRIMVCSEPAKAKNARKVLDNQGRRIWPNLSF